MILDIVFVYFGFIWNGRAYDFRAAANYDSLGRSGFGKFPFMGRARSRFQAGVIRTLSPRLLWRLDRRFGSCVSGVRSFDLSLLHSFSSFGSPIWFGSSDTLIRLAFHVFREYDLLIFYFFALFLLLVCQSGSDLLYTLV